MFIYKNCGCSARKNKVSIPTGKIQKIAGLLKLVSVPSRLSILLLLNTGPHCVCDIIAHLKMSQTLASHHLSDLTKANLVTSEKKGNFMYYSLTNKGKELVSHLKQLTT